MAGHGNAAPVIIKKKKVVGGDGHHGGAWKVAYADFVTAMMAFFMLMWLLNATTEKQRRGLADYFSPTVPIHRMSGGSDAPFGGDSVFSQDDLRTDEKGGSEEFSTENRQADGATGVDPGESPADKEDPLRSIEEQLLGRGGESLVADEELKHIVTRVTDQGLIIELFDLEEAPLFEPDSDTPTQLMRNLTTTISQVAEQVSNPFALSGHVAANPVVFADNPVWELSSARAAQTRRLLEFAGTAPERIHRVTGHADRSPILTNRVAVRNNRVEIVLLRSDIEN